MLVKMKFANDIAEFISIGKEQLKQIINEPDPEEKEESAQDII